MKIKTAVKNTLWPRRGNNYHPYLLNGVGLAISAVLIGAVMLSHAHSGTQVLGVSDDITPGQITELSNQARLHEGLGDLKINPQLQAAAAAKAADMLKRGYWNHYGPDGTAPWSFLSAQSYSYAYAGENLAKDFATSSGVVNGWLSSPSHRKNLLDANYREIGVATVSGNLQGHPTTVVVAFYGTPATTSLVGAVANGQILGAQFAPMPGQAHYAAFTPVTWWSSLNSVTKMIVLVLVLLIILYTAQHIILRKHHLAWGQRRHAHPLFQAALLLGVLSLLVVSGFGAVL